MDNSVRIRKELNMIEWKDLETKYGWLLDIERAKKRKEDCKIDFKAVADKAIDYLSSGDMEEPSPKWVGELVFALDDIKSWGNRVGYVIDFETFGEYSRRYSRALDELEKIIKEHDL